MSMVDASIRAMRRIDDKNRVDASILEAYENINLLDVIRETLLCKGVGVVNSDRYIYKKLLEDSALYLYDLKANATNRLFVGLTIDRLCQVHGLSHEKSDKLVMVPVDIYNEINEINNRYKRRYL